MASTIGNGLRRGAVPVAATQDSVNIIVYRFPTVSADNFVDARIRRWREEEVDVVERTVDVGGRSFTELSLIGIMNAPREWLYPTGDLLFLVHETLPGRGPHAWRLPRPRRRWSAGVGAQTFANVIHLARLSQGHILTDRSNPDGHDLLIVSTARGAAAARQRPDDGNLRRRLDVKRDHLFRACITGLGIALVGWQAGCTAPKWTMTAANDTEPLAIRVHSDDEVRSWLLEAGSSAVLFNQPVPVAGTIELIDPASCRIHDDTAILRGSFAMWVTARTGEVEGYELVLADDVPVELPLSTPNFSGC